jgi:hypothetical protein
MRRTGILSILLASLIGCEEGYEIDEVVPIENLPPAALKAAQEKLPGVKFDTAWKEKKDGQDAYEIRGKTPEGKVRDAKVTADGKVLEVD